MSIRGDLQAFVARNPGQPLRAIAAGIGMTTRAQITTAGAQLCQLVSRGKLRTEGIADKRRGRLYFPTSTTGITVRRTSTPEEKAARYRARQQRKKDNARQRRQTTRKLTGAQVQAFYKDLPRTTAPKPATFTVARRALSAPKTKFAPNAEPETVAEWTQRTGKQPERLPQGACSKSDLRFDHSANTVPTGKRRPALRGTSGSWSVQ